MAAALRSGDVRGTRGKRQLGAPIISDINVTPFVDVMLVLLIIFMVAAPLLTVSVPVELPASSATPIQQPEKPVTVSVQRDGSIFLGTEKISAEELVARLLTLAKSEYDQRIFVQGDRNVDYGTMVKVMGVLNAAGFRKIALVSTIERRS